MGAAKLKFGPFTCEMLQKGDHHLENSTTGTSSVQLINCVKLATLSFSALKTLINSITQALISFLHDHGYFPTRRDPDRTNIYPDAINSNRSIRIPL